LKVDALELEAARKWICENLAHEGVGTLYERYMVVELLDRLRAKYGFKSVCEYGCEITKGYDNLPVLGKCDVTLYDAEAKRYAKEWQAPKRPAFTDKPGTYDFVWSFALAQMRPGIVKEMVAHSKRYVLVCVPNYWNPGTFIHWFYHRFSQAACTHAERGSARLRTVAGVTRLVRQAGLRILEQGYVDLPLIPDIGFSLEEAKREFGLAPKDKPISSATKSYAEWLKTFERLWFVEKNPWLPGSIKSVAAHHIYVFAEKG